LDGIRGPVTLIKSPITILSKTKLVGVMFLAVKSCITLKRVGIYNMLLFVIIREYCKKVFNSKSNKIIEENTFEQVTLTKYCCCLVMLQRDVPMAPMANQLGY